MQQQHNNSNMRKLLQLRDKPNYVKVFAHIDLDCFYCQVEHRRLNIPVEEPLAVRQWESVIAVNYAARRLGIKRGTPCSIIERKYPNVHLPHVDVIRLNAAVDAKNKSNRTSSAGDGIDEKSAVSSSEETSSCISFPQEATRRRDEEKISLSRYRHASDEILSVLLEAAGAAVVERASIDEVYIDLTCLVACQLAGLFQAAGAQAAAQTKAATEAASTEAEAGATDVSSTAHFGATADVRNGLSAAAAGPPTIRSGVGASLSEAAGGFHCDVASAEQLKAAAATASGNAAESTLLLQPHGEFDTEGHKSHLNKNFNSFSSGSHTCSSSTLLSTSNNSSISSSCSEETISSKNSSSSSSSKGTSSSEGNSFVPFSMTTGMSSLIDAQQTVFGVVLPSLQQQQLLLAQVLKALPAAVEELRDEVLLQEVAAGPCCGRCCSAKRQKHQKLQHQEQQQLQSFECDTVGHSASALDTVAPDFRRESAAAASGMNVSPVSNISLGNVATADTLTDSLEHESAYISSRAGVLQGEAAGGCKKDLLVKKQHVATKAATTEALNAKAAAATKPSQQTASNGVNVIAARSKNGGLCFITGCQGSTRSGTKFPSKNSKSSRSANLLTAVGSTSSYDSCLSGSETSNSQVELHSKSIGRSSVRLGCNNSTSRFSGSRCCCCCGFSEVHALWLLMGAIALFRLRKAVREKTTFTMSGAVATTKFLAKLASSRFKPNRQVLLLPESAFCYLSPFAVRSLNGLRQKRGARVAAAFPHCPLVKDLLPISLSALVAKLGPEDGTFVYKLIRGEAEGGDVVKPNLRVKSMLAFKSFSVPTPATTTAVYLREQTQQQRGSSRSSRVHATSVREWLLGLCEELQRRAESEYHLYKRIPRTLTLYYRTAAEGDYQQLSRATPLFKLPTGRGGRASTPVRFAASAANEQTSPTPPLLLQKKSSCSRVPSDALKIAVSASQAAASPAAAFAAFPESAAAGSPSNPSNAAASTSPAALPVIRASGVSAPVAAGAAVVLSGSGVSGNVLIAPLTVQRIREAAEQSLARLLDEFPLLPACSKVGLAVSDFLEQKNDRTSSSSHNTTKEILRKSSGTSRNSTMEKSISSIRSHSSWNSTNNSHRSSRNSKNSFGIGPSSCMGLDRYFSSASPPASDTKTPTLRTSRGRLFLMQQATSPDNSSGSRKASTLLHRKISNSHGSVDSTSSTPELSANGAIAAISNSSREVSDLREARRRTGSVTGGNEEQERSKVDSSTTVLSPNFNSTQQMTAAAHVSAAQNATHPAEAFSLTQQPEAAPLLQQQQPQMSSCSSSRYSEIMSSLLEASSDRHIHEATTTAAAAAVTAIASSQETTALSDEAALHGGEECQGIHNSIETATADDSMQHSQHTPARNRDTNNSLSTLDYCPNESDEARSRPTTVDSSAVEAVGDMKENVQNISKLHRRFFETAAPVNVEDARGFDHILSTTVFQSENFVTSGKNGSDKYVHNSTTNDGRSTNVRTFDGDMSHCRGAAQNSMMTEPQQQHLQSQQRPRKAECFSVETNCTPSTQKVANHAASETAFSQISEVAASASGVEQGATAAAESDQLISAGGGEKQATAAATAGHFKGEATAAAVEHRRTVVAAECGQQTITEVAAAAAGHKSEIAATAAEVVSVASSQEAESPRGKCTATPMSLVSEFSCSDENIAAECIEPEQTMVTEDEAVETELEEEREERVDDTKKIRKDDGDDRIISCSRDWCVAGKSLSGMDSFLPNVAECGATKSIVVSEDEDERVKDTRAAKELLPRQLAGRPYPAPTASDELTPGATRGARGDGSKICEFTSRGAEMEEKAASDSAGKSGSTLYKRSVSSLRKPPAAAARASPVAAQADPNAVVGQCFTSKHEKETVHKAGTATVSSASEGNNGAVRCVQCGSIVRLPELQIHLDAHLAEHVFQETNPKCLLSAIPQAEAEVEAAISERRQERLKRQRELGAEKQHTLDRFLKKSATKGGPAQHFS